MEWYKSFLESLKKHNFEAVISSNVVHILCPKTPDGQAQSEINQKLPKEYMVEYVESPKQASTNAIKAWAARSGATKAVFYGRRDLSLMIKGQEVNDSPTIWDNVLQVIKNDGYWESWKIFINGEDVTSSIEIRRKLEEHNDRPERETIILQDEITNLKIALEQKPEDMWKLLGVD